MSNFDLTNIQGSKGSKGLIEKANTPAAQERGNLGRSEVTLISEAKDLAKKIEATWNSLPLDELAEKIVSLEKLASKITDATSEGKTIQNVAEHLHFQFVHPLTRELEKSSEGKNMYPTFSQEIGKISEEIIHKGSIEPFLQNLSRDQQLEVIKLAQSKGGLK